MKTKAYFSPFLFVTFSDHRDAQTVISQCEQWGQFLMSNGFYVPSNYLNLVRTQIEADHNVEMPRWVSFFPISRSDIQSRFELHSFGGILPNSQLGFVHGDELQFRSNVIAEIFELKLADVAVAPCDLNTDQVQISGRKWALYLHLKLLDNHGWRKQWSGASAPSVVPTNLLGVLKREIGEEFFGFKYPMEIKAINDWLFRNDQEVTPEVELALRELLKYSKTSWEEWQKLRLR